VFLVCRADLACDIALEATSTVSIEQNGRREIDIKRYAKVEKVHSLSLASKLRLAFCSAFCRGQLNLFYFWMQPSLHHTSNSVQSTFLCNSHH